MQRIFRRRPGGPPPVGGRRRVPRIRRLRAGGARRLPGAALAQRLFRGRLGAPSPPAPAGAGVENQPAPAHAGHAEPAAAPGGQGFRDRGRLRRRLRHLRRARELGYRDLGGLLFDLRRFGRSRPDLVEAKLDALGAVDRELRTLEVLLDDRRPIHELREPGITSCPRCGALHSSEAHFCPNCGLPLDGPRAMGELGGAIAAPPRPPTAGAPAPGAPAPAAPDPPVTGVRGKPSAPAGPPPDTPTGEQATTPLAPRQASDRGS